jgi:hypothetical protein
LYNYEGFLGTDFSPMPTVKPVERASSSPINASTPPTLVVEFLERPLSTVADDDADVSLQRFPLATSPISDVYAALDVGFEDFPGPSVKPTSSTSTSPLPNPDPFLSSDFIPPPAPLPSMNPLIPKVAAIGPFETLDAVKEEMGKWQFWVGVSALVLTLGMVGLSGIGFLALFRLVSGRRRQSSVNTRIFYKLLNYYYE